MSLESFIIDSFYLIQPSLQDSTVSPSQSFPLSSSLSPTLPFSLSYTLSSPPPLPPTPIPPSTYLLIHPSIPLPLPSPDPSLHPPSITLEVHYHPVYQCPTLYVLSHPPVSSDVLTEAFPAFRSTATRQGKEEGEVSVGAGARL